MRLKPKRPIDGYDVADAITGICIGAGYVFVILIIVAVILEQT